MSDFLRPTSAASPFFGIYNLSVDNNDDDRLANRGEDRFWPITVTTKNRLITTTQDRSADHGDEDRLDNIRRLGTDLPILISNTANATSTAAAIAKLPLLPAITTHKYTLTRTQ